MSRWEKLKKFLKNPGVWLWAFYAVLALLVAADIILAVLTGGTNPASYALYFFTLVFLVYCICASVRPARTAFSRMIDSNKVFSRMAADYGYRTVAFSVASLIISGIYAVAQGVLGIVLYSAWYGLFSGYYIVLSIMRGIVIALGTRKSAMNGAWGFKVYLACGGMFIILSVALASLAGYLIVSDNPAHYGVTGTIAMAAYAFYKIIVSAIHIIKNKKYGSFFLQALRNINFADALVSIFALQIAMVATFGGGQEMQSMNIFTGAAAFAVTLGLGIYMIVRSLSGLYKFKKADTRVDAGGNIMEEGDE